MKAKIFEHDRMESHPFYVNLLRVLTVPLLNLIPARTLQRLIKKSSSYGTKVIEKPGTTHSLELMYNRDRKTNLADSFWHNFVSQPKAVRNRLKIVEMFLEQEIETLRNKTSRINIYNIGGGSSRAIIHAVSRYTDPNFQIQVTTIDKDPKALVLGKQIAEEHGVADKFNWIEGDARNLQTLVELNSADIVEMVGLLDYFDYEGSVGLIKQIYNCLKPEGLFLVANVHPNRESKFVENVGWPKMHYKTSEELSKILLDAGFSNEEVTLHMEPLKVHLIGVARK